MSVTISFGQNEFQYDKTEYFCPDCGKQSVWEESGEGDYYVGSDYICTECAVIFTMPTYRKDDKTKVFADAIKNALAKAKEGE